MSGTPESVIDLVRKLIAHEESARSVGSIAEAQAFAQKIQELLLKHKLDMSAVDIETEAPLDREYIKYKNLNLPPQRIENWAKVLIMAVAKAHFCHVIFAQRRRYEKGEAQLWVVGRVLDRAVTVAMFRMLYSAAVEMAAKGVWRYEGRSRTDYKKSFGAGFARAIRERTENTVKVLRESTNQAAIVRVDSEAEALALYIKDVFSGLQSMNIGSPIKSTTGFADGRKYGSEIGMTSAKRLTA